MTAWSLQNVTKQSVKILDINCLRSCLGRGRETPKSQRRYFWNMKRIEGTETSNDVFSCLGLNGLSPPSFRSERSISFKKSFAKRSKKIRSVNCFSNAKLRHMFILVKISTLLNFHWTFINRIFLLFNFPSIITTPR